MRNAHRWSEKKTTNAERPNRRARRRVGVTARRRLASARARWRRVVSVRCVRRVRCGRARASGVAVREWNVGRGALGGTRALARDAEW